MSKRKSKATHQQRQFYKRNNHLRAKLTQLDDDLYNLLQSHLFYQQSMMALTEEQVEPEGWLIGALVTHRWLRQQGETLMTELVSVKQSLKT